MRLRSFKLHIQEQHVRIVPATDASGCAFGGPGVTLRGEAAAEAIARAAPVLRALDAFEPGIRVRSLSIDLERLRLLGTLHPAAPGADARGRVVRIDGGPAFDMVLAEASPLVDYLKEAAAAALARRARRV